MNGVKVSVLIATYNTAKYITECLDSIVSQTLKQIETIIIDDGSTDNTQEILKKYVDTYSNIFVYYQENVGAGLARNKGIELANGEYMVFMDPDDKYPTNDCLEILYNTAKSKDVLICGGNIIGNDNGKITKVYSAGDGTEKNVKNDIIESKDFYYLYGHTRYIFQSKFMKKSKIKFAPYRRYEDQVLTIDAIGKAGKFFELDYPVYEYRINYKSDQYDKNIYLDMFKGFRDTLRLIGSYGMQLMYEKNCQNYINSYMPQVCKYKYNDKSFSQVIDEINKLIITSGWSCKSDLITDERIVEYINRGRYMKSKFDEICNSHRKVLIYGAGNNTKKLLNYYGDKLRNVIGIAVTQKDNVDKLGDIEIHSINEYVSIKDEVFVLITPSFNVKDSIITILDEFGFNQYEWIDINSLLV